MVTVLGRTDSVGYECLECSDERYRYDRSTHGSDAGRVTGSSHDYSYPHNFKRENAIVVAPPPQRPASAKDVPGG